ncbi:hypothetical protein NQ176_g9375 [Zarea fungicola]|uniref:Uncharacterized protein n=1 Tax=Zarea fungicola TaxID=93591 RepID=A0ACC1MMJ2_9HYPO|nr:hypothetical protein NQ176_g9375 [Lecanicillium fungicola]
MRLHQCSLFLAATASRLLGYAAADAKHSDTVVEVQYQPFEIVCSGKTTTSTAVQTVTKSKGTDGYVTITHPGSIAATHTIPPHNGQPGTVIIDVPGVGSGYVTITQPGPVATSITIPPSNGHPGTVIIQTTTQAGNPGYVTIIEPGPVATTRTIPPKNGNPGTVIIDDPNAQGYVTITESGPVATTRTIPPKNGNPGTVIIDVPYVTITSSGSIAATITVPPTGTNPGTVIIETTAGPDKPWLHNRHELWYSAYHHHCSPDGSGTAATTITVPPTGTNPGTVIIETTAANPTFVTITSSGAVATTITVPPTGTNPGTIIIETTSRTLTTPASSTSTSSSTSSTTTTSSSSSSTSTSSSTTSATPSCTPGLKWAYYKMAQAPTNTSSEQGLIPYQGATDWIQNAMNIQTIMQGNPTPDSTGITQVIGVPSATGQKIGDPANNCGVSPPVIYGTTVTGIGTYFVVQHIGYFHPDTSGDYRFAVGGVDDGMLMWLGSKAISGWTNANADLYGQVGGEASGAFHYTATAGQYVPIRITIVQAERCSYWNLTIQDPTLKYIESADIPVTDSQLTSGCGANTPDFSF